MATKVTERRQRLLEVLEKKPCSIEQMAVILNTSRRTLETDIKELRKEGNEISVYKDVISLKQKKEVVIRSTPAIARQVKILMLLKNEPEGMTKQELQNALEEASRTEYSSVKEQDAFREALRKRVESDLKDLLEKKKIYMFEADRMKDRSLYKEKAYALSMNSNVMLRVTDRTLEQIYKELVDSSNTNTYGDILFQITKKIYDAIDSKLYGNEIERVEPIVLQNYKNEYRKYEEALKSLFSVNYKAKQLEVEYFNRYGELVTKQISIGTIVFLTEKGSFYLIGKGEEAEEERHNNYISIEMSRVQKIRELLPENEEFGKIEYNKICEEMLNISAAQPLEICMEYRNTGENLKKVKEYAKQRSTFSFSVNEDVIVCKDTIRGKHDFARFLRGEGNEVYVKSPKSIVYMMKESAEELITRYRDEK